jgi:predicted P-loop ATPase
MAGLSIKEKDLQGDNLRALSNGVKLMTSISINPNIVKHHLEIMHPSGKFNAGWFDPKSKPKDKAFKWREGSASLDMYINRLPTDKDVYVHIGEVKPGKDGKCGKKDMDGSQWAWVEFDPPDWDKDKLDQICKDLVAKASDLDPDVIVYSGRGVWAYFRLDKKYPNDVVEAINYAFTVNNEGADNCFNIDRVARLAGTVNQKTGRLSEVTVLNKDRRRSADDFEQISPTVKPNAVTIIPPDHLPDECQAIALGTRLATDGEVPWDSGSEWLLAFVGSCLRKGVPESRIMEIATDSSWPVSDHPLRQDDPKRAVNRAIEEARKDVSLGFARSDKDNKILPTRANFTQALVHLGRKIVFNSFTAQVELDGKAIDDNSALVMRIDFEETVGFHLQEKRFLDLLNDHAQAHAYHPVQDYLAGLEWDGVKRIDRFFTDQCGAPDDAYTKAVSRLFFLAAVTRINKPGCKFDELPTFEGQQGINKSSLFRKLAVKEEWFTDSMVLTGDIKVGVEQTLGKWIVEIAELRGKGRVAAVKAWLSFQVDRVRLAYQKQPAEFPRQWIAVGTTNVKDYLSDPTGDRRFWPIPVEYCNLDFDVHQLWAEAMVGFRADESIRLPKELWADAAAVQASRQEFDLLTGEIEYHLQEVPEPICRHLFEWLGYTQPVPQKEQSRVGKLMVKLGYERKQRMTPITGKKEYHYVRLGSPIDYSPSQGWEDVTEEQLALWNKSWEDGPEEQLAGWH